MGYDDFNCREALRTDELVDQIKRGATPEERWWDDLLTTGQITMFKDETVIRDGKQVKICVGREIFRQGYYEFIKKHYSRAPVMSATEFGIKLREFLPLVDSGRRVMNADGRRVESIIEEKKVGKLCLRSYVLPSLAVCRELWDFRLKRKYAWPEPIEWEEREAPIIGKVNGGS